MTRTIPTPASGLGRKRRKNVRQRRQQGLSIRKARRGHWSYRSSLFERLEVRAAPGSMLIVPFLSPLEFDDLEALRSRHMGLWTEQGAVGRSRSTRPLEHLATKPSEVTHRSDITDSTRVAADAKRTNRNAASFTALHPDDRADTGLNQAFFTLDSDALQPLRAGMSGAGGNNLHDVPASGLGNFRPGSSNVTVEPGPTAFASVHGVPPPVAAHVTSTFDASPTFSLERGQGESAPNPAPSPPNWPLAHKSPSLKAKKPCVRMSLRLQMLAHHRR